MRPWARRALAAGHSPSVAAAAACLFVCAAGNRRGAAAARLVAAGAQASAREVEFGGQTKPSSKWTLPAWFPSSRSNDIDDTPLTCGRNPVADARSREDAYCPPRCPLHVERRGNKEHCDFYCIQATSPLCAYYDPKATVVDLKRGACRPCVVEGCAECRNDGSDTCRVCGAGYSLLEDGKCRSKFWWAWIVLVALLTFCVVIVMTWILDLAYRPCINEDHLIQALGTRSRAKLRMEKDATCRIFDEPFEKSSRDLWPISTNLCRTVVAGPGLLLSFNFQAAVILWAIVLGLAWVTVALVVDIDMFRMGTRQADSPRDACIIVSWGYETQRRLLWSKVGFVAFCYIFTFVGSLLHGVRQLRMFQHLDEITSTHKDFCAVAKGIPPSRAGEDEELENDIKAAVRKATGESVVAVSVAWLFQNVEEEVSGIVEEYLIDLDLAQSQDRAHDMPTWGRGFAMDPFNQSPRRMTSPYIDSAQGAEERSWPVPSRRDSSRSTRSKAHEDDEVEAGRYQRLLKNVEKLFLSRPVQKVLTRGRHHGFSRRHRRKVTGRAVSRRPTPREPFEIRATSFMSGVSPAVPSSTGRSSPTTPGLDTAREVLQKIEASNLAFVVFNTEAARDAAVHRAGEAGVDFRGGKLTLERCAFEPDSVSWENFVTPRPFHNLRRFAFGFGCIFLALLVWCLVFYVPFIWVSMTASYTQYQEPTWYSVFTFSMIVVLGNVMMYTVCSEVTDRMRFTYRKDHEVCYMLLYTLSCVINVLLDMIITYCVASIRLEGSGIRTNDGTPMSEVPTHIRKFISYGMQRELGENLKEYAFPGTFLIPFVIEPIMAIYLPWQIMTLLVRCHGNVDVACAEEYLRSTPFDLSRYGDIHLNVILAVLIFFFPGGYTFFIFFGLVISHTWIYIYDHYRALRFAPSFVYANMDVDWWASWMFCLPCAFLLCAMLVKLETEQDFALSRRTFGPRLGDPDRSSVGVALLLGGAFTLHVAVHTLALFKLVPLFGRELLDASEYAHESYRECAERLACSWLTSNPVHCLRSLAIHKHEPPIAFCMRGKEHLLQINMAAGQYFQDTVAASEAYEHNWASPTAMLRKLAQFRRGFSESLSATHDAEKEDGDQDMSVRSRTM